MVSAIDIHGGSVADYYDAGSQSLLDRWSPMAAWSDARARAELESYSKSTHSRIAPRIAIRDRLGRSYRGVNFASQDYLGLATDPHVVNVACDAARRYGVHSAGSAALMGLTEITLELEERIAAFLEVDHATVFPTGWAAGFGIIRTLVKETDHIVIDVLAHACLQEGASLTTKNVHRFPHCSTEGVERRLARIRAEDPKAGILVVTEGIFSMDSDTPDIAALQALCRRYGATLLVDVAHDLGCMGPSGRGQIEIQGMLGDVDLVMGSFSKTFASNGGFVATNHPALKLALRYACGPSTFSNALSPVQAAAVLAALDVIESPDGADRRAALLRNSVVLRGGLAAAGFSILGVPSAIVPVVLGDNRVSRLMTRDALRAGAIVNLVEYPAVARNACRWRLQVMSEHQQADLDTFVSIATAARASCAVEAV